MKKYFIMAVAVLASLTACQKDPEQVLVNDGTIKFMSAPVTRADATPIVDLSTFQNNGKSFTVYGYTNGETIFDGIQPTHSAKGEVHTWTPEETKYWADAKHYNFYAFYNQGSNSSNTFAYAGAVINFEATEEADKDFVMASNCNILGNVFNAPVQLNFRHQLSRVAIKFVNKFNDPNMTITVSDVKVYAVPTGAKFTYTAPTGGNTHNPSTTPSINEAAEITPAIVIADTDKKDVSFEFQNDSKNDGIIVGVAENVTTYNGDTTIYKYFVPTEASVEYYMSCRVKFTTTTQTGATDLEINNLYGATETNGVVTCNQKLKLNSIKYEAGQGYIFTANIYDTVNPITFSVDVKPWSDTNVEGSIEIGNR